MAERWHQISAAAQGVKNRLEKLLQEEQPVPVDLALLLNDPKAYERQMVTVQGHVQAQRLITETGMMTMGSSFPLPYDVPTIQHELYAERDGPKLAVREAYWDPQYGPNALKQGERYCTVTGKVVSERTPEGQKYHLALSSIEDAPPPRGSH